MDMTKMKLEESMELMEGLDAQIDPIDPDENEDKNQIDLDEEEETERKPPAVVNSNQGDNVSDFDHSTHDRIEENDDQQVPIASIVHTEYAFGTTPSEIGMAIPE
jgi:hypothetical protein